MKKRGGWSGLSPKQFREGALKIRNIYYNVALQKRPRTQILKYSGKIHVVCLLLKLHFCVL